MKILKNINFAILAVVLGLGLVVTQSAFTSVAKTDDTYWVFDSNDIDDAMTAESYINEESAPGCGSSGPLPCVIVTPSSVNTPVLFQLYLDDKYDVPADITADLSVEKRN
ncbi:MAG: hypothetical protein EOO89_16880 [Pedobacter sp.]|nr:MAG: hypothetical protein EOO89_16880 [Pedobacter sp.]